MIQYYTVTDVRGNILWIAYHQDAPDIRGVGISQEEALCNLTDKLKAILDTIRRLQDTMGNPPC